MYRAVLGSVSLFQNKKINKKITFIFTQTILKPYLLAIKRNFYQNVISVHKRFMTFDVISVTFDEKLLHAWCLHSF